MRPTQDDAEQIRRLADDIVSRRAFRPDGESVLDRVLGWIGDALEWLLPGGGPGGVGGALAAVLLGAGLLGLLYVLARYWKTGDDGVEATEALTVDVVASTRRSASEWRRSADEAAADGRWHQAVAHRFRAAAAELADRHLVAGRDDAATSSDLRRGLVGHDELAEVLDRTAPIVDDVLWGDRPAGPEDDRQVRSLDETVTRS